MQIVRRRVHPPGVAMGVTASANIIAARAATTVAWRNRYKIPIITGD
jgi:hypothetical protein